MEIVVADMLILVCICLVCLCTGLYSGIANDIFILWQCCKGWSKAGTYMIWFLVNFWWTFNHLIFIWHYAVWCLCPSWPAETLCNCPLKDMHLLSFGCFRRIWLVWSLPKSCGTTLMISSKANSPQAGAEVMLWVMTCRDIVLQWLHHDSWMPCGCYQYVQSYHPPSEGDAWLVKDKKARLTRIFFFSNEFTNW